MTKKYLVDESGVVLDTINEGDRIVKGGAVEYLLGTVEVKFKKFYKVNELACADLSKYGQFLFLVLQYIGFADGILIFANGRKVRPKHLAGMLGKKSRSGARIINELIENDIIHKHKDGRTYYFTFNPYIAIKGNRITKELYDEFKDTKYRIIEKPKRKKETNETIKNQQD